MARRREQQAVVFVGERGLDLQAGDDAYRARMQTRQTEQHPSVGSNGHFPGVRFMKPTSQTLFQRLAAALCLCLITLACTCRPAAAQAPVASGSVIPLTHGTWNQISKVQVAHNGSVVLLDWANSGLYQLPPGSSSFTTLASGAPLEKAGTFWNAGLTMDAKDTLYITDRYGANHFFRVPYNPADGTWDFTSANAWGATIGGGLNTFDVAFINSSANDGSGTLVVSTETSPSILTVPVDNQGNWGTAVTVIKGLKARAVRVAADVNGNIYFVEDTQTAATGRSSGLFFIPAGTTGIVGSGDGSAEAQLARIDPTTSTQDYQGITLDAAGNIYLSNQADSNGGTYNGTLLIPNVSGSPVGVTASSFDFSKSTLITPVQSASGVAIDPRGFLWIPTATNGWTPPGSLVYPGTNNVVLWAPGSANLGASPVGTAGPAGTVFFTFSSAVTPGSLVFTQPGTGSDFTPAANPIVNTTAVPQQTACTPGQQYLAYSSCPVWVSLDARSVGNISGQLTMLDASNKAILNSPTYLSGVGQGPAVSLLVPTTENPLSTGLTTPQQVATDSLGNVYVADPGQGKVLEFPAGSAAAPVSGTALGAGFSSPTGVAVDGSGNVFVADSGKVTKIPYVNGALSAAGQTVLASGLGAGLQLAADGQGNIYVADPSNGKVDKINSSPTIAALNGITSLASGFTKPTAIAVDASGNVFVADGSNLVEVSQPLGVIATITKSLAAPVTGLTVEPSGSVDVAQSGGIIRIPVETAGLNFNDAVAINSGGVTAPNGVALDHSGNLYATAPSYSLNSVAATGPTTTTVSVPNVLLVSSSFVNFGIVSTATESSPTDVSVYNIGSAPLLFTGAPTFSGVNGTDYLIETDGQTPCDTSGGTAVDPATACTLGVTVTAANNGLSQGTMTVPTNAVNAPAITAGLTAFAENNLCRTQTTITLNPATGVVFPGSTQVMAATTPLDPTCSPGNQPGGGKITLTLTPQTKGAAQIIYSATLTNGAATFDATALPGGTYATFASYKGDTIFGGSSSPRTFLFTVAAATPTVTLTEPSNTTPVDGVYYVQAGVGVTLQASVTSTVGTPVGSVAFMNGSQIADPTQTAITLDGNGNATFSTQNLPAGTYSLTAVYSGDPNFASTSSPAIVFQVIPKSVLITANPASLSIKQGAAAQSLLTLTSLVGYSALPTNAGGVFIACDATTLPQYSECTFDVPQVTIASGSSGTTTVTITTNLPVNVASTAALNRVSTTVSLAGLFGLGLVGLTFRRRIRRTGYSLALTCLGLLMVGLGTGFLSGCTNGSYTQTPPAPHVVTPKGSYNVRFYATDAGTGQVVSLPYTLPVTVQ